MKKTVFQILGKVFLFTSPIALFCSRNGNGITLCAIFLSLGGICKWIGDGGLNPTIRVKPKDWWETHYRLNIQKTIENGGTKDARADKIARGVADCTTQGNRCPMPSEEEKERIAQSMGITTYKMIQDKRDSWDRLQIGKRYLLKQMLKKYKGRFLRDESKERMCVPSMYIKAAIYSLETYGWHSELSDEEEWNNSLSQEEKKLVQQWIDEYEQRLIKEMNDYIQNGIPMPTIRIQCKYGAGELLDEYNRKYGFTYK